MERLNRKKEFKILKEIPLEDGTIVAIRSIPARALLSNVKEKNMSQEERGFRIIAQMMLVKLPGANEFREIVYEDMLDCFSLEELTIVSNATSEYFDEKNV